MSPTSAADAERKANRLRSDLAVTLDQIADNLAPSRLAAEALAGARDRSPQWLKRSLAFVQSPAGLAILGSVAAVGVANRVAVRRRMRRRL